MKRLNEWFNMEADTEPVSDKDVEKFVDAVAKYHKMPALKGAAVAEALVKAGYTTTHGLGGMEAQDMKDLGFPPGHAKILAAHLGARDIGGGAGGGLVGGSAGL